MCRETDSSVFVYRGGNQKVPKDVLRVKIDSSCSKIERSAFARCSKLIDVEFAEKGCLEEIGFSAFYCCSAIEFLRLPSTTRIIGNMAFAGCIKLKDVVFNDGLEQIKVEAFSRCSSLEEAILPATVELVGKKAFAKCNELVTVSLNEGLVRIDDGAFSNSNKLEVIQIPASVEAVGKNIVPDTTKQERAIIQENITPENAEIVETEMEVATEKVEAAPAIKEKTEDTTASKQANAKSKTWSSIVTSVLSPSWKSTRQSRNEKKKNSESLPTNPLEAIAVPSPNQTAVDDVFVYMGKGQKVPKDVTRVRIDPSVKKIERSAFARCRQLASIEFSDSLLEIGFSAFYYCSSLTLLRLPPRIEVIGNMAFLGCTSLLEVCVPATVIYVGKGAFANCPKLDTVSVSVDGNLSNSEKLAVIKQILSTTGDEEKEMSDPDVGDGDDDSFVPVSLRGFLADANFQLEDDLSAILGDESTEKEREDNNFEKELEEAAKFQAETEAAAWLKAEEEEQAAKQALAEDQKQKEQEAKQRKLELEEESRLQAEAAETERVNVADEEAKQRKLEEEQEQKEIEAMEAARLISEAEAAERSKLEAEKVDTTQSEAFLYIGGNQKVPKDVTRVKIDSSCSKIERSAFARCRQLTEVDFSEGLTEIGFSSFYNCSSLELVRLPSTTRIIGNMAFAGCIKLKDVVFNDGLEEIKKEAFSRCSNLGTASIPLTVVSVGKDAFASCPKLLGTMTVTPLAQPENLETTAECKGSEGIENDADGDGSVREQLKETSMTWTSMTSVSTGPEDEKENKGMILRNQLNKRLSLWKSQPKLYTESDEAVAAIALAEHEAQESRKLEAVARLLAEAEESERLKTEEDAIKKVALEDERKQRVLEAAAIRRSAAAEAARLKAEAEEAALDEERKQKVFEAAARRRAEAVEAARLKVAAEEASLEEQRKLEEATRLREEAEAAATLKAEGDAIEQALLEERKQKEVEETARRQAEAVEAARLRAEAEAEEAARVKAEKEAALEEQRKRQEAARLQTEAEAEEARWKAEQEAKQLELEEDQKADEAAARLNSEEEAKEMSWEEERWQKEVDEVTKVQAEAEDTVRNRKIEEEAARLQAIEYEARQLQACENVDRSSAVVIDLGDWTNAATTSKAADEEMEQLKKESKWNTELTKTLQGAILDRDEEIKTLRQQIEDKAADYEAKLAKSAKRTEESLEQLRVEMKQSLDMTRTLKETILSRDEEISTLRHQVENAEVKLMTVQMDFETFKTESLKIQSFSQIQSEEDKEASKDYWWMDEFD